MLLGIDHLVIAVADPDLAAVELVDRLGLRASGGGRHDTMGTYNRLVWLGDSYVELIGVADPPLAATSWVGRPTLRMLERGGGLATYALASDDLVGDVARLRSMGSRLDGPHPGERTRPDGRVVRWSIAVPPTLGPADPAFLIEHDATAAEWAPAERAERAEETHPVGGPVRLLSLAVPVPNVPAATMAHLRTLGLAYRPSLAGRGARDASVGEQTLRVLPAREADDQPTIRLRVLAGGSDSRAGDGHPALGPSASTGAIVALGCRWELVGGG